MLNRLRSLAPTKSRFHEIEWLFSSKDQWTDWAAREPWVTDQTYITDLVQDVAQRGYADPLLGRVAPHDVVIVGDNYRETITAHGAIARHRAVLLELVQLVPPRSTVYAPEAVTPFAGRLRRRYGHRFIGSEYLPTEDERTSHPTIRHEDVQQLSFDDHSLDAYVSCEILEHVPSIERTMGEARRVLRPGGVFIATFPFLCNSSSSRIKALLSAAGAIEYLDDPEYHGNPVGGGSLVFTLPAWDVVENAQEAGFADPHMIFRASRRFAITGAEMAGVFVMRAFA